MNVMIVIIIMHILFQKRQWTHIYHHVYFIILMSNCFNSNKLNPRWIYIYITCHLCTVPLLETVVIAVVMVLVVIIIIILVGNDCSQQRQFMQCTKIKNCLFMCIANIVHF